MNALKYASYILAVAMAALGIWLSSQDKIPGPSDVAAPPPMENTAAHDRAPPESR